MLPLLVNLLPDNMSGAAKTPTTVPAPVMAVPGEPPPAARTQLANAVAATAAAPAFAAETPQPAKPALRALTSQSSSQLAAQYIAQIPDAGEEDLKIFAAQQNNTNDDSSIDSEASADNGDDYLAQLRIARGDPAPAQTPAAASQTSTQAAAAANAAANPTAAEAANNAAVLTSIANATNAIRAGRAAFSGMPATLSSQFISRLPTPVLTSSNKKPGVGQVRGASAYQLASARNSAQAPTVTAVL